MNEFGKNPWNFACVDRCTDTAAAERDPALNLFSCGVSHHHGDDEVGIVVSGIKLCAPKSTTSYPEERRDSSRYPFKATALWSPAILTHIAISSEFRGADGERGCKCYPR
jgi:hypothetical protein